MSPVAETSLNAHAELSESTRQALYHEILRTVHDAEPRILCAKEVAARIGRSFHACSGRFTELARPNRWPRREALLYRDGPRVKWDGRLHLGLEITDAGLLFIGRPPASTKPRPSGPPTAYTATDASTGPAEPTDRTCRDQAGPNLSTQGERGGRIFSSPALGSEPQAPASTLPAALALFDVGAPEPDPNDGRRPNGTLKSRAKSRGRCTTNRRRRNGRKRP